MIVTKYYIGVDLGTSAVKLLLVDQQGVVVNAVTREYPLYFPHPGWSEQDPEDWWSGVQSGLKELLEGFDRSAVAGIGCGGQMHGLVVLDEDDKVIRKAILWNDGRTAEETEWLNTVIGRDRLSEMTANIAFAGFTAPKILWLRNKEPEHFARIRKIMLPKDYINFRLTRIHACDFSDASGMLLLDVECKQWSGEMLDICDLTEAQMPRLFESYEVIGYVREAVADTLGLPDNEEILMLQTKFLAGIVIVVRIKHLADGTSEVLLLNSLLIITLIKVIEVKGIDSLCIPDTKSIYDTVSVAEDRKIIRNSHN